MRSVPAVSMCARFHFWVDGLWIDRSVMGASREFELDGRRLLLEVPGSSCALAPDVDLAWMQASGARGEETKAEAIALRVTAQLESDLLASEFEFHESKEFIAELERAWSSARALVGLVLEWAGINLAQSQHAQSARVPPRPTGRITILDRNGDRVPPSWNPPLKIQWRGEVRLLDEAALEQIESSVGKGERPSEPRQLLADAEFHAFHAQDQNPGVALVLAAVACEMAVKKFMLEHADARQSGLAELVIANPRDVSLAAASLYDKGLGALGGQSLKDANKDLYKAVTALFEHRNRFAHGRALDLKSEELRADLRAARGALDYLQSLAPARETRVGADPEVPHVVT